MSIYTTGEIAKLCDVSVRTVQFYDTKDLLKPSEFTQGGRRLYTDEDLKKLRLICLLKSLGLTLNSIKEVLESKNSNNVLLLLLDEQAKHLDKEIKDRQNQMNVIKLIKENIKDTKTISANSIADIEQIVNGKLKLKKTYAVMLITGIIMDVIQIALLVLWITTGNYIPFIIGMPIVIVIGILLLRMYYKNTAYICAECNKKFKPKLSEFIFSKHTPKTRKLTCTKCGHRGYCIETCSN